MPITDPDWVPPIEATFDTGKAIRSEQGLMLAGNPIAARLGKPGAPYDRSAWHPYNGATYGDGATGQLWSFPANGAVASVTTPDFVAGYDYRIMCYEIQAASTPSGHTITVLRSDNQLYNVATTGAVQASSGAEILHPWRSARYHLTGAFESIDIQASTTIRGFRVSANAGNMTAGVIYLYRRLSNA